nr:putative ribonuclease H-like domain-containing protein [Tanacetum cinerariifolium]
MIENLKLLINFVWKFLRTFCFGNDHVAVILGFGDLQWGNILITRVYFVEGLGHNLFSVGQFCDSSLEVAFRRNTCFFKNLERVDLLKGNRTTNLYTITLHEMASASPICLIARATSTKKSKRASHPPKPVPNSKQRLHLLHMDFCGLMRIASINGKRRNTCFIRDLYGVDLLKGNRSTNLYTINLYDMASASLICLMARATPTKSWLWHQRLSHLNFDIINDLAKNDLVSGLPKFEYAKEHLCPSCEQGKSKRALHPPKPVPNSKQRLHLLHMDLCGPMRVASINAKRYVLVIVDDYSRYTWVHFLKTKHETPEVINNFLKKIYVRLQAPVIIVRTDNGTELKNQVLKEYFDSVGIIHETSAAKNPQQNGVVKRKNRTLVEAART